MLSGRCEGSGAVVWLAKLVRAPRKCNCNGAVYKCRCLAVLGLVESGAAMRLLELQASRSGGQGCRLPCSYHGVTMLATQWWAA